MGRVNRLVEKVYEHLSSKGDCPSRTDLHELFKVLFTASLMTEELNPVRCGVCYTEPSAELINRYCDLDKSVWGSVSLHHHLEFNAENIRKISLATGDNAGLLGVNQVDGKFYIWGFIDQWTITMNFIEFNEQKSVPARPGLFIASIDAPGVISVYDSHKMIAMLNRETVEEKFTDSFLEERFTAMYSRLALNVCNDVCDVVQGLDCSDELLGRCGDIIFETIYRIILRMTKYKRGGAVVIMDDSSKYDIVCDSHYKIHYSRLRYCIDRVIEHEVRLKLSDARIRTSSFSVLPDLHFENVNASDGLMLALQELEGCIEFIAGLTKIDGAVVIDSSMTVLSFGTNIICKGKKCQVYCRLSDEATPTPAKDQLGHRHNSMIQLCSALPGTLGIVVSQDGAVKVVHPGDKDGEVHMLQNLAINRIQIKKVIRSIFSAQDFLP